MSNTYLISYFVGTHKHNCKINAISIPSALSTFSILYDVPSGNILSIFLLEVI